MSSPVLEIVGLEKVFPPAVRALDGADLTVRPGEVHCLLGANGAGKSTLVKVLAGAHRPDRGHMTLLGEPFAPRSPTAATERGIGMIYQELDLVPDLTVAQNLFLGRAPARGGVVSRSERDRRAREVLHRVGASFSPRTLVGGLSVADQQLTAIARALTTDSRLVIMDEPTATLHDDEVHRVFEVIRGIVADGRRSVLYISHRLDEVLEIGDRATVMRNGRSVVELDLGPDAGTTTEQLVDAMIGDNRSLHDRVRDDEEVSGEPVLDVRELEGPDGLHVHGLEVRAGEIVGLAGLAGAGRTTLLRCLFGALGFRGEVLLRGRPYAPRGPRHAIAAGVGLVPENRKTEGLILDGSVLRNATLSTIRGSVLVRRRRQRDRALPVLDALGTKRASLGQPVRNLSGGNQQKVVMSRWLLNGTRVLLLDEPSRGLDVGAKAELYARVRELADDGAAVLVASSELEELLANADRIVVVHEGRNVADVDAASADHDETQRVVITGSRGA